MPSIFSLAPTQPVSRGLAAEVTPLYPEQIALMQQFQKTKAAQAAGERESKVENLEWFDSKVIDTEKLAY